MHTYPYFLGPKRMVVLSANPALPSNAAVAGSVTKSSNAITHSNTDRCLTSWKSQPRVAIKTARLEKLSTCNELKAVVSMLSLFKTYLSYF